MALCGERLMYKKDSVLERGILTVWKCELKEYISITVYLWGKEVGDVRKMCQRLYLQEWSQHHFLSYMSSCKMTRNPNQSVESNSPPVESGLDVWWQWSIKCNRSDVLRLVSPGTKKTRQLLLLCSERSQWTCKKSDCPNISMLWESQLVIWRG